MVKWIISGRRWFDRVNGNTYHSVAVTNARTGRLVYKSGMQYGYGDQYKQTATDYLKKKGYIRSKDQYNYEKTRGDLHVDVSDVARQRDLDHEEYDILKPNKKVIMENQLYDKEQEMRQHLHRQKMERLWRQRVKRSK